MRRPGGAAGSFITGLAPGIKRFCRARERPAGQKGFRDNATDYSDVRQLTPNDSATNTYRDA